MVQVIRFFFLFCILLLLQAFVLDKIPMPDALFGVRPVVFFFVIIALPVIPAWMLLLLAFFTGLTYDVLYHTPGIHAAAVVFIAFIRDYLLGWLHEKEEGEEPSPHITYMGFGSFFMFLLILSFFFHLIVTFLSVYSFSGIGGAMLDIVMNTLLSALLIYIFDIIFFYRHSAAN